MKKKNLTPIKHILDSFLKKNKLEQKIKGYQTVYNWVQVVGKKIAGHSQPIKIQGQTLFLKVESNVWANELNIRRGEIINKINSKAGEEIINDIRFRIQPHSFKNISD
ncbi:MAG: DUF721 domain-containing protein [Candidatus Caldatribacteriota bacterium]|nr:DUF721 domain-containing protein [Candidatus Caldatribacteriota bacterium]